ncbi:PPA1309 family protein [Nakamurella deserti]|uniref:PPA1309 family protein n=1 Tax=Nakamurella deserti TaxID=2164074 RepID=UPI0014796EDA|nr:PPA1309 family protein [Nakamurella deserti]
MTSVPPPGPPAAPAFLEDPFLAVAVSEAEEFVGTAGWDQQPQLFALVRTAELIATQPEVAGHLDPGVVYTPIAQDPLPSAGLPEKLQQIAWPPAVAGCVLVQEIVVLPPSAQDALPDDPAAAAAVAAVHPERTEARLAVGVLRDGGAACLMRLRGDDADTPLRGADLAPNLVEALRLTFQ